MDHKSLQSLGGPTKAPTNNNELYFSGESFICESSTYRGEKEVALVFIKEVMFELRLEREAKLFNEWKREFSVENSPFLEMIWLVWEITQDESTLKKQKEGSHRR